MRLTTNLESFYAFTLSKRIPYNSTKYRYLSAYLFLFSLPNPLEVYIHGYFCSVALQSSDYTLSVIYMLGFWETITVFLDSI